MKKLNQTRTLKWWTLNLLLLIPLQLLWSEESYPKNVILLISDGCGYSHIKATNFYQFGEDTGQVYERFPIQYGMSTHCYDGISYNPNLVWKSFDFVKKKPTDSAAAATAMSTGVKTHNGKVCIGSDGEPLTNIIQKAETLGKATGVVTSVQFSHATPAGFVAHNPDRDNYSQIAQEMILRSGVDIIMGCGHPYYDDNGDHVNPSEDDFKYVGGDSIWQALIKGTIGGDADGDGKMDSWVLIQDRESFQNLSTGPAPKRVLGIPKVRTTLQQKREREPQAPPFEVPFIEGIPTLHEMVSGALNVLDDDPDGFFLMIEGGAIDWASHDNQSGRMIEEEIDFNRTVETVVHWVESRGGWNNTLVIVTGDHETGYLTGPGSGQSRGKFGRRLEPLWNSIVNQGKGSIPLMQWNSGDHTNSLIPLFAKGAGSSRLHHYADETDPVHGQYLDNTEVAQVLFDVFIHQ